MVGHGGSSAGSYLADPTSPIPSHCASIVVTSTLRVNYDLQFSIIVHGNVNICVFLFAGFIPKKALNFPLSETCRKSCLFTGAVLIEVLTNEPNLSVSPSFLINH